MTPSQPIARFVGAARRAASRGGAAPAVPARTHRSMPRTASPGVGRAVLVAGCVVAVAIALACADPFASSRYDHALAQLLWGMAAIKTLIVAAAVASLAWRLGRPVTRRIAASYLVGAWLVSGATTAIWQLSSIVPAAVLFHVGLLTLLVATWRDEASPWSRALPRRRIEHVTPVAGPTSDDAGLAPR